MFADNVDYVISHLRPADGMLSSLKPLPQRIIGGRYAEAMSAQPATVDEYLDAVPPAFRAELERIRTLVTRLVPDVEESMSFRMPTLTYKNRALVYFTASKRHLSFFPSSWAIDELRGRLAGYKTTQHAIQFTPDKPLPSELIEDLVRVHVREIDAGRQ